MPRKAREKHNEAIYHIICRSMSEILLFRDDADKEFYLKRLKKTVDKYKCSVYSYCLLDNHVHIQLDPKGYDISKFMHSLNTSYVIYYNKKYKRHGHLFQDRFQSKILDSDRYNLVVSAYIHMNPKDVAGMTGREEEYKHSSYGIYLGLREDDYELLDIGFIQEMICSDRTNNTRQKFIERYRTFVEKKENHESLKELRVRETDEKEEKKVRERKIINREISPSKAMFYIASRLKLPEKGVTTGPYIKKKKEVKAFAAYVLRVLCGLGYRQICEQLFNITTSGCSTMCERGYELTKSDELIYKSVFEELQSYQAA